MSEFLTIGHSVHEADEFLRMLRANGVELLADVRRYPASRRSPNRKTLCIGRYQVEDRMAAFGVRRDRAACWLQRLLGQPCLASAMSSGRYSKCMVSK